MAAGTIITVLSNIPWGAVVENAPKVADGAARLWSTVTRRNKSDPLQNSPVDAPARRAMSESELLAARLQTVEESVRDLNDQMQASTALIKDLAEQNTSLIQRIELLRSRLLRWGVAAGCAGALLLGSNLYLLVLR